ncbi:MAG: GNAT family N-acetyltransferase [Chitinophagaceae bacterium]
MPQPSKDNHPSHSNSYFFRPIQPSDNEALARIIRTGIVAMGVPTEGTAYTDPTTDDLFQLFQTPGAFYYVAVSTETGEILGGCGVYPTPNLPTACAEMVRFFLQESARGKGIGHALMQAAMQTARELAYTSLYIETFTEMKAAVHLYEHYGFEYLPHSLGNSGHPACTVWMMKGI